jgi:hypothetical protein
LEEVGPGRFEADLEHLGDHRLDLVDRSEQRLERIAACRRGGRPHPGGDLLGGDRASVRPGQAREAEGVAKPVVGDDPALGQRRLDLARRVESHQPLRNRRDQEGGWRVERLQIGIGERWRGSDRAHLDRSALGIATACREQGQSGESDQEGAPSRHCR